MEWSTYSIRDFVPFTDEAYASLFAQVHDSFWPFHFLVVLVGFLALAPLAKGFPEKAKNVTWSQVVALAASYAVMTFTYYEKYQSLNWAGEYLQIYGVIIALSILVLARRDSEHDRFSWAALASLVLFPLLTLLFSARIECFGVTPFATSLTVAVWSAGRGRRGVVLSLLIAPMICVELFTVLVTKNLI